MVTVRGWSQNRANGSANHVLSATDAGARAGDWILVGITSYAVTDWTIPSGWTTLVNLFTMGTRRFSVFAGKHQAGDGATCTFSHANSSTAHNGILVALGDCTDLTDATLPWVIGTVGPRNASGLNTRNSAPGITAPKGLVISLSAEATGVVNTESPGVTNATFAYYSDDTHTAVIETMAAATRVLTDTTTTEAVLFTGYPTQGNNGAAIQIGIPDLPTEPPPEPEDYPVLLAGNSATAYVVPAGGGTRLRINEMKFLAAPTPPPIDNWELADLLADDPFYIAHRCGSERWAEMSEYGAAQSAAAGYKAIEFSFARTSDGVFFGLHDQTLDRTSNVTGNISPANLTWAQVQAYTNRQPAGGSGGAQPYWRLQDFLETYGDSHVLFLDPKYSGLTTQSRNEAHALIKSTVTNWQDRVVMKFSGDATWLADIWGVEGFQRWGYFYQADASTIASRHTSWDILGMDHTADATSWDLVRAPGKPVIGHVVSNSGHALALSHDPEGIMFRAPGLQGP